MGRITRDEQHQAAYERIFAEIEDQVRAEWNEEFGEDNPRFPFAPDRAAIHREVTRRLDEIERNRKQDQ